MGWPTWTDLLVKLESTVTSEQLEQVERERDQWIRAHDALARHNAVLRGSNATLRSALWVMMNWRMVASTAAAVTVVSCGWWWWSAEQAKAAERAAIAAAEEERAQTARARTQAEVDRARAEVDRVKAAVDAALRDNVLSQTRWGKGDSKPRIEMVGGTPYWVVVRGTLDTRSHSDTKGRPIELHCLQLYASEAKPATGDAYVTPSPYLIGDWVITWPPRAAECRMPGARHYQ